MLLHTASLPIKGAIEETDTHRPVCIAAMSSHTIIPGLASAPVSSRSRRPVLLMAAALTVLAVGFCVVSQTGIVSMSSFTSLHWSYDEVDMWEGADCQHGSTQVRQSDHHLNSCDNVAKCINIDESEIICAIMAMAVASALQRQSI